MIVLGIIALYSITTTFFYFRTLQHIKMFLVALRTVDRKLRIQDPTSVWIQYVDSLSYDVIHWYDDNKLDHQWQFLNPLFFLYSRQLFEFEYRLVNLSVKYKMDPGNLRSSSSL